jgi:glycosyltransferase involved in cell wall biosynthesis
MPKISVVIASYNHEKYVRAAIESVLAQSFRDLEILVTDDGSVDRTVAEVQAIADPRLSLVALPRNGGACAAINASIRRASGEYVAIQNSDDVFLPGKLAKQVHYLDAHADVAAVFARPLFIGEDGRPYSGPERRDNVLLGAKNGPRHEWLRHFFLHGNALCHPSLLIRRRCYEEVGLYNPALAQLPDLEMWVRLLREHEIHLIEEPLVGFRIRDNEMNASAARLEVIVRDQWEWLRVLEQYLNLGETLLAQVFPELAGRIGRAPIAWLVAKAALQNGSPAHVLFALETMYKVVADGSDGARCRAFIAATGGFDPFGMLGHLSENRAIPGSPPTGATAGPTAEKPLLKADR